MYENGVLGNARPCAAVSCLCLCGLLCGVSLSRKVHYVGSRENGKVGPHGVHRNLKNNAHSSCSLCVCFLLFIYFFLIFFSEDVHVRHLKVCACACACACACGRARKSLEGRGGAFSSWKLKMSMWTLKRSLIARVLLHDEYAVSIWIVNHRSRLVFDSAHSVRGGVDSSHTFCVIYTVSDEV